jgi:hypothetical protein
MSHIILRDHCCDIVPKEREPTEDKSYGKKRGIRAFIQSVPEVPHGNFAMTFQCNSTEGRHFQTNNRE